MGIFDSFKKKVRGSGEEEKQKKSVVATRNRAAVPKPAGQPYKIGDRIGGKYEIHRILGGEGKSGMGIVYICYDHEGKGVLALKTFQDKYLFSKGMKDNFKKEALLWTHLERHPYIVKASWVQELDYRMFVGCEFIAPDDEGRNTLTHYLNSPISLKQALTWSIQFCHGMEHAFSRGVTPHRDIKPDNIMITKDGVVKIADFGLAGLWQKGETADELKRHQDVGDSTLREGGKGFTFIKIAGDRIAAGTPPWMSPEQFDGEADERSDIYSFGVVMYQMVNGGNLPFYPNPSDNWETAHKTYPVPPLRASDSPLTKGDRGLLNRDEAISKLSQMIERCLNKRPEERYSEFKGLRGDVEGLYEMVIGENPPSPPGKIELEAWELVNKGVSLANLGLIDEAIREYKEAIRIKPDDALAHSNLGAALKDKGLIDEAIREYREALRIKPDIAEAHNNLGVALKAKGLIDEAIREYREALRIKPDDALAHSNLGAALKDKGLIDEAIREYREAIRIKPDYAEAHLHFGNALADKGLIDEAIKEYREALRIKPDYAEAHLHFGNALADKGLIDEAIKEYREALRIKPDYAEAHSNLGNALKDKGLIDEAIKECREAIRIKPDLAEAHYNLGLTLAAKRLPGHPFIYDEAIREYREAIRIKPDFADAHNNLGVALAAKGVIDEAIKAFEDFIRYAPPQYAGHVEKIKELIKQLKGPR